MDQRGEKNFVVIPFFCSHKFHKIEKDFIFEMLKKKIWANFQRIIELSTQKIVTKLSKIWVWDPGFEIRDPGSEIRDPGSEIQDPGSEIRDPGSGKNLFRIPDPRVRKAPDPGSRIRDPGSGSATLILAIEIL
jgi:hypothetical protein